MSEDVALDLSTPLDYAKSLTAVTETGERTLAYRVVTDGRRFDSYVDSGTEAYRAATALVDITEPVPKRCFANCKRAVNAGDRVGAEIEYCEGYALPPHGLRPTRHAWVLVDGDVAELTFSSAREGVIPPMECMYAGVTLNPADAGELPGP